MTLIPILTFDQLRVVSKEHLQRVRHASRKRLTFRTPRSVRVFGLVYASIVDTGFPQPATFRQSIITGQVSSSSLSYTAKCATYVYRT